jgi:hypothetical protein
MGWDVPGYPAQDFADALRAGRRFAVLLGYQRRADSVFEITGAPAAALRG